MNEDFKIWIKHNEETIFTTQNSLLWLEYYNGDLIKTHETVEIQNNEAILYNIEKQIYLKLNMNGLSQSYSLDAEFDHVYNGSWLNQKLEPIKQNVPSSSNQQRNTPKLLKAVNKLMESKKKTEELYKSILASELTTESFDGPFGPKKVLYLDYTASGRPLSFIEECINKQVLPNYSNTHSDGNYLAESISSCRNDTRGFIKKSLNAIDGVDDLIFVGSGSTAAIHKLIGILDISNETDPPIVIVSPYEHHSNLLPWRQLNAEIVYVNDADDSSIDFDDLEQKLKKYKNQNRLKIGSFTAASNVTGILVEVEKICILLHKYGFLSFWDYSTAAPHVKIDMNPDSTQLNNLKDAHLAYKDAVFFSGHKFIGGPQTPGVLVAKSFLFQNRTPHNVGGGTVLVVTKEAHVFDSVNESREEGGTPAIVESIRLGLVFKFKDSLNTVVIEQREHQIAKKSIEFFKRIPNMILLGNTKVKRLPIFSFLIKNQESGYYLHYNFVTKLLNDLFGIQSRSGCACAGPYGHYLLGINSELAQKYVDKLVYRDEQSARSDYKSASLDIFKPGFTRFNIPFFLDDDRIDFILNAIEFICKHGWKFLPLYEFKIESGKFWHVSEKKNDGIKLDFKTVANQKPNIANNFLKKCFEDANKELNSLEILYRYNNDYEDQRPAFKDFKSIRWFLLPSEAIKIFENSNFYATKVIPPFTPKTYADKYGTFNSSILSKNVTEFSANEWFDFDTAFNDPIFDF